jgi:hypothetical protein
VGYKGYHDSGRKIGSMKFILKKFHGSNMKAYWLFANKELKVGEMTMFYSFSYFYF